MPSVPPRTAPPPAAASPTATHSPHRRRLPIGAEVAPGGGVHFRVWAPARRRVEVVFAAGGGAGRREVALELESEAGGAGYFSGFTAAAGAGDLYRFRLDGGDAFPDPASRFQPEGPHGPSRVVDPGAYRWRDAGWRGAVRQGQVIYELHVGTFTREGTWAAAARRLPGLAELGVTTLEVMPVAEFAGRFGWGYDGVDLFAPSHLYGEPDDFRRFVDAAHGLGLGVILDVVYNHLGPDGNYLEQFAPGYFTDLHATAWGKAIHFYGFQGARAVRELFVANAAHWIAEYRLDGLRLDATQDIHDRPARPQDHVLAEIGRAARRAAAALPPGRSVLLVAESEPQESRLVRPLEQGGHGLDAMWSDDFHHAAMVALTGRAEAYFSDYRGTPQELVAAVKFGSLYQGQRYHWQGKRRGSPALDLPRAAFVFYLQNHDQVANSARGERLHRLAAPGCVRAMTALLLLGPATPLLFQGQESGAAAPFVFFADHHPELAGAVRRGRLEFLAQFPSLAEPAVQAAVADPGSPATFALCNLEREATGDGGGPGDPGGDVGDPGAPGDLREGAGLQAAFLALHRDLLRLRREDPVFRLQAAAGIDGAVLGPAALALRWFAPAPAPAGEGAATMLPPGHDEAEAASALAGPGDRLLVINLGVDLELTPAPEPLLAPPEGARWQVLWSSEDPRYGGAGAPPPEDGEGGWKLAGHAAIALRPVPREPREEAGG
ncbi:MAG: malto-oligosyltrehalose trehalohydrolase [Acidobacteria bacterium]|nr:malto-oligosyltrehalose trehalohydrolase [Acidobacteriota bacterium]